MSENRDFSSSEGPAASPCVWASPQRRLEYDAARFVPEAHTVMTGAGEIAQYFGQLYVAPVHLLMVLCHDVRIAEILARLGVSNVDVYNAAARRATRRLRTGRPPYLRVWTGSLSLRMPRGGRAPANGSARKIY